MNHRWIATLICALACAAAPLPAAAQGKTLRYASAFDPQSMDPHALALLYQTRVVTQVYEGLVNRAKDYKLEPSLATVVGDGRPADLALQAAPGREVPRRQRRSVPTTRCSRSRARWTTLRSAATRCRASAARARSTR